MCYIYILCLFTLTLIRRRDQLFFFPNSLQACMSWVHLIDQDTMRIHSAQLEHRCLSSTVIIAFKKNDWVNTLFKTCCQTLISWTMLMLLSFFFLFKRCFHVWVVNSLSQILESCRNSSKVQIPPSFLQLNCRAAEHAVFLNSPSA